MKEQKEGCFSRAVRQGSMAMTISPGQPRETPFLMVMAIDPWRRVREPSSFRVVR